MEEGALVAFNSAVDAVECAISLQEELARDQEELPSGERIVLRIGINLADVVIEGDDLLGDGVYVAARLEASAEPGGICIADGVHRQLGGKCRTAFLDGGEISLKNIARPVHVWHSRYAPIAAPSMSSASARTLIAVLPFENLCSSPTRLFSATASLRTSSAASNLVSEVQVVQRSPIQSKSCRYARNDVLYDLL